MPVPSEMLLMTRLWARSVLMIMICSVRAKLTITLPNGIWRSPSGAIESNTKMWPVRRKTWSDTARFCTNPLARVVNMTLAL